MAVVTGRVLETAVWSLRCDSTATTTSGTSPAAVTADVTTTTTTTAVTKCATYNYGQFCLVLDI